MKNQHKIAYVSRVSYPHPSAHALQTMHMAAAFARQTNDTHLFVKNLASSREKIYQNYSLSDSPLRIWSLYVDKMPSPFRWRFMRHYNAAIAAILGLHPIWWGCLKKQRVLFVRSPRERMFWGAARSRFWWLKEWVFVGEAHDVCGLDPRVSLEENPFDLRVGTDGKHRQRRLQALENFDLLITVTKALADDLREWSYGELNPYVVRHASALQRLSKQPKIKSFGRKVVLGYIGTIDRERGVDSLIKSLRFLPDHYELRLVGRIRCEDSCDQIPTWLISLIDSPAIEKKIELVPPVPINDVAREIDRCDILLQPSSDNIISLNYRAPLKLFDYMVRGKPIIAADVPCHKELLKDRDNALLYKYDDPRHLAACIQSLVEQPSQAEEIAKAAWEQAANYSYDVRAQRILSLVDGSINSNLA